MPPLHLDRSHEGAPPPPCHVACPAGENVRAWLAEVAAGRYRAAWEIIVRDNPLPAVTGRLCTHPCEEACQPQQVDRPVSIRAVERILGDLAVSRGWSIAPGAAPSGRRILIVGAGPCGLAAAWHLARRGHTAVVFEAGPRAAASVDASGGSVRVPRAVLDAEIARITRFGVELQLNRQIADLLREKADGGFDAVLLTSASAVSIPRVEVRADGSIVTGADMQTGYPGIFAATGPRDFATEVGGARKAAQQVDSFLRVLTRRTWTAFSGSSSMPSPPAAADERDRGTTGSGGTGPQVRGAIGPELDPGGDEATMRSEAERCLSCLECDG